MFEKALWVVAGAANCDSACRHSHICARLEIRKLGRAIGGCGTLGKHHTEHTQSSVYSLQFHSTVIQQSFFDGVHFSMTKNRHNRFEVNLPSRQVTLSFGLTRDFPVGCLLCLVKEVIYFPDPRIKAKSSPPCLKPVELCFFDDAPKAQKCEHSSSQLLGSPCEGGIRCPLCRHKMCSLWLALSRLHSQFQSPDSNWLCHPLTKAQVGEGACKELDYVVEIVSR